jgi:hypothetical protein
MTGDNSRPRGWRSSRTKSDPDLYIGERERHPINTDIGNVSLFPLRDPDILISIRVSGSDIWPKGHLRLLFLRLKNLWAGVGDRKVGVREGAIN